MPISPKRSHGGDFSLQCVLYCLLHFRGDLPLAGAEGHGVGQRRYVNFILMELLLHLCHAHALHICREAIVRL